MTLQVRPAIYEDITPIKNITREAFEQYASLCGTKNLDALNETEEDIKSDIENKIVLVAIMDGIPVGCVRVQIFDDSTAYLTRFCVKADCQKNGIGKLLINHVDEAMKKNCVHKISLHTGKDIDPLIKFYTNNGFLIESTDNSRGYQRALLTKIYN